MKTLFTVCLWPMALIGLGLMAAVAVGLVRLGWRIGAELLVWVYRVPSIGRWIKARKAGFRRDT